jgi:hypothetical protein
VLKKKQLCVHEIFEEKTQGPEEFGLVKILQEASQEDSHIVEFCLSGKQTLLKKNSGR